MENLIKVNRPLFSAVREYALGKGVTLNVDLVCEPMIHFLCEELEKDGYSLVGDIGALKRRKQEIEKKRISEMTYQEHLQELVELGLI